MASSLLLRSIPAGAAVAIRSQRAQQLPLAGNLALAPRPTEFLRPSAGPSAPAFPQQARALPWQLPENMGEVVFEGTMHLALCAMWGSILLMSMQALSVVVIAHSTGAPAVQFAARSLGSVAANPGGLVVNAVASSLGVVMAGASNSIPGTLAAVLRGLFVAIFGTLLHLF